ncbi:nucleotide exchange factor GrpE [Hyphomicrobiales bacterium]|jgi:molecular chaperone GrpE|nr:nucleotide exchange factor GrpE [Hyphomicrobiales bacterium]MDA9904161.1 nucleotide exchange factor GrpE [Hyphomicrobiales bacterium]MDB4247122.1 nucleotide exchange factor GrpE [Hyphomicrobiales bacterium]MDB9925584.1 nucleotide exchange factor GrpE [Hyphomicrobiales bacterium]
MEEEAKEEPKENEEDQNIEQKSEEDSPEISKEDQIKDLEDKLLRSAAEIENIRKRAEKERSEAYKIGISIFVKDFVPVLDNIQRALESIKTAEEINYDSFIEGISATETDITSLLEKHGIKQINPLNEKFDPLFHEALFETPSEDQESGIVTQVIDLGYILDKRLIRPAKVGVSSKK